MGAGDSVFIQYYNKLRIWHLNIYVEKGTNVSNFKHEN